MTTSTTGRAEQTASPTATPPALSATVRVPESLGYRAKRKLLGKPLVNDQLHGQKLSNPIALGIMAIDCISSSAYGSEQMLTQLIPYFGVLGFMLVMPITGVILGMLVLLTLCYRDVVGHYTKAGGSYVVARENFGPRFAQVAAVALLIDYVVTVAVQVAAGSAAVASVSRSGSGGSSICWPMTCTRGERGAALGFGETVGTDGPAASVGQIRPGKAFLGKRLHPDQSVL